MLFGVCLIRIIYLKIMWHLLCSINIKLFSILFSKCINSGIVSRLTLHRWYEALIIVHKTTMAGDVDEAHTTNMWCFYQQKKKENNMWCFGCSCKYVNFYTCTWRRNNLYRFPNLTMLDIDKWVILIDFLEKKKEKKRKADRSIN